LIATKPGLQFNGHETGDGELILRHAGKLGFEGVVSKTIDAPLGVEQPPPPSRYRKKAALMERTTLRHLTQEEIALNEQELTCRAELEKLEMQEAQLESELEQDIDESRKMRAMFVLKDLYKELLVKHRELARIKDVQITFVQRTLRAYGGD
jgi:hypothetical protein